jgi:hypothetical protein
MSLPSVWPRAEAAVRSGRWIAVALAVAGLAWSLVALFDPARPTGAVAGPLLSVAAWALARRRRRRGPVVALAVFTTCLAVCAAVGPEFRADTGAYYAYLRSLAFDHDLDFSNEWEHWKYPEKPRTPTGLARNIQSVGPALLWSPGYLLAHLYVLADRAVGADRYAPDGYSEPYRRSVAIGTLAMALAGAVLLAATLRTRFGPGIAALSVTAAVATSPVVYYLFVVPGMAHGAAFGAAAALVWAWDRARAAPSLRAWIAVGALLGLVTLIRWQAAAYLILVGLLAGRQLADRAVRGRWLLAAAAAGLAVFTPQLVAWKLLYGRWLTVPQGSAYIGWSAPHLADVLLSAHHGLFSWTPAALLGLLGLAIGLRREALLNGGALAVFAATAWVNGSVADWDWDAGDAFGARRFDVVVPLFALGTASLLGWARPVLQRRPLLLPAALLACLAFWNAGFIARYRAGAYPEAAPLDRLAAEQARGLRRTSQWLLGLVAGDRGRALAYKYFSAEYLYTGFSPDGAIALASADERILAGGWSSRGEREEGPAYRWALFPEACLHLPLDETEDRTLTVTARAPRRVMPQSLTAVLNGRVLGAASLGPEWRESGFPAPATVLVPGENLLCLRFSAALPGEEGARAAAAVAVVRLH